MSQPWYDANYWCNWDRHDGPRRIIAADYEVIRPIVSLPDGDILFELLVLGRWSDEALLILRAQLAILLPGRHLVLPHHTAFASVVVRCGTTRQRGVESDLAVLGPAAYAICATIFALRIREAEELPPLPRPLPKSPDEYGRLVELVGREVRFESPIVGYTGRPPNRFQPPASDHYNPKGRWVVWRPASGRPLYEEEGLLAFFSNQHTPVATYRALIERFGV